MNQESIYDYLDKQIRLRVESLISRDNRFILVVYWRNKNLTNHVERNSGTYQLGTWFYVISSTVLMVEMVLNCVVFYEFVLCCVELTFFYISATETKKNFQHV